MGVPSCAVTASFPPSLTPDRVDAIRRHAVPVSAVGAAGGSDAVSFLPNTASARIRNPIPLRSSAMPTTMANSEIALAAKAR